MKKLKYVLIALAVIILAVGGYVLYEFKFKTYDVADEEIDTLLEETFEVQLPDGTTIVLDKDGNVVESKVGSNNNSTANASNPSSTDNTSSSNESNENKTEDGQAANDSSETSSSTDSSPNSDSSNSANPNTNENSTNAKPTVQEIKTKYAGTFTALENQARDRINALISRARSEYSAKKSSGESIQFGYFYNKYMGAANSMEASVDGAVSGVMSLVEKELETNGYDKSHAQSFQDQYNATKKALRDEMLSKALSQK